MVLSVKISEQALMHMYVLKQNNRHTEDQNREKACRCSKIEVRKLVTHARKNSLGWLLASGKDAFYHSDKIV